ncbi:MAG TPA: hypothetical protein VF487_17435 [Chitinophagaceae bacterium]
MKFYQLDTIFSFGKHQGKSLLDVFKEDEEYINWCQANLDHFNLPDKVIVQLQAINPDFSLSMEAIQKRNNNHNLWLQQQKEMEANKEQLRQEREADMMSEEMDSYNPYTEECGDIDNDPDFSIDPFDEN